MQINFRIRNDVSVKDKRLDRLHQFDQRSKNYSIADLRKASGKLRAYTWRCRPHFDQGNVGACVAFAMGHELAARPSEVTNLNYDYLLKEIYWEAQRNDPWEGGSYPGASPQYEGTSVLAGVKAARKLGHFNEYRWAFNTNDALYGIGHNGPAVIGVNWYAGMLSPDSSGFITPTGSILGGHAVLVRAINMKKGYVTIRNSWGLDWGINGDCYMSFDDFDKLLSERGECCFMLNRHTKAQPK